MINTSKKMQRKEERRRKREAEKQEMREAVRVREENKTKRNISNRKCGFGTVEEEMEYKHQVGGEALKVYKKYLPEILKDLSRIKDPRNPKKIEHKQTMLMLYGILMFVFHITSRREANQQMTRIFIDNIKEFFPEFDSLPHADALARLLEKIDVKEIEGAILKLVKRLMADKKLDQYKVFNRYIIAIDGTGKFSRDWEWCKNCLKKHAKGKSEDENKYYVYALEASLVLPQGLTIPIMTEFLDRSEYSVGEYESEELKQDCERKAFKRLAKRLKEAFPRLEIAVTLDGLFANGPVIEICKDFEWDYMITLKDKSLKTVWENINGLVKSDKVERHYSKPIGDIQQEFWWVNGIEYNYGDNGCKSMKINVVVCLEYFFEIDKDTGLKVQKERKFVWLSYKEITKGNVEKRCNYIGRPRWNIETQNLVQKHHGYSYEHCFSYDWNAMKGFHYLMHLGYIINLLTLHSKNVIGNVMNKGVRGTVKLLWNIFSGSILDYEKLNSMINIRYQVRLEI